MTHYLKTLPEYYRAAVNGEKPFEIRKNDRNFKVGDTVVLKEYLGKDYVPACKFNTERDCEGWAAIDDVPEYGEDEAIAYCEKNRSFCGEYYRHKYSGHICEVKINQIFDLSAMGLKNYVAFTFVILGAKKKKPFTLADEVTE